MSRETFLTDWSAAIDAFNGGDCAPMKALYADGATHTTEGGVAPRTGPAIVTDLYQPVHEKFGWRHQIISLAGEGEFLTSLYRNYFADGTSAMGCGIVRLDQDGKIVSIVSYTESGVETPFTPR